MSGSNAVAASMLPHPYRPTVTVADADDPPQVTEIV
jgi:hypothetical protein